MTSINRPFCLTHVIACTGTHANQTVHALCHMCKRSSSCVLGLLAYEVKLTIALTLLELEDYKNSAGTIHKFFNSYLACFSVLG